MKLKHFTGIIDSTLREGEQTPGVGFTFDQKKRIIIRLLGLGIDEIELGVASPHNGWLPSLAREVRLFRGRGQYLSVWCRCKTEDIDFAARCGVDVLSLSMPVSDLHISHKLFRDRDWVVETLVRSIHYASAKGFRKISVGFEDATRADRNFLQRCIVNAANAGAMRVRLADTVGIATPGTITDLVNCLKSQSLLPLGVHAHNDFGMATANSVAAIEAGAAWVDASVLGLGERCGSCRLEELVGYLSLLGGQRRYRPDMLPELCSLVADAAHLKISPHHPIVGEKIFTCETGLHVHGLMEKPETYEPFNPQRLGKKRVLRFGGKSGKKAVLNGLASMGIQVSEREAAYITASLKRFAGYGNESLDSMELLSFARKMGIGKPLLDVVA